MKFKGFISGSYQSQSPLADFEQTFNWYPEHVESQAAPTELVLYPTPGVRQIGSTYPGGGGRAHFAQDGREFVVIGPTFAEVDSAGNPIPAYAAAVAVDTNPATISSNGKTGGELMITSGGNVYIFTLATNAFNQVASMNGKATMGDQIDGYFLVLDSKTSTFYFSALNDGQTWNPTVDFANRNAAPDAWVAMKVANKYIWLLGSETSEIWYDAGTFPMPFAPYPSALLPYGCAAPFSPAVTAGMMTWLGQTGDGKSMVLQSPGFTPNVISTYALSNVLNNYGTTADAVGDCYVSRGHTFYLLSFPTENKTICYDQSMQLWHDRGTWIAEENRFVAWRPRFHAFAYGQHRMLDSVTGAIYQMDEALGTDVDGRPIRRLRRSPEVFNENQRLFIDAFELDLEPGLGNTPQDPLLELYQYTKSFWQMEESVGNRVDQFGLNDLTPNAAPGNAAGIIGNALSLSKAAVQSVSITDAAQTGLNPSLYDFSLSFWIYPTTISGATNYSLIRKGNTGAGAASPGYLVALRGTGLSFPGTITLSFGGPPSFTTGLFCRYQVTPPLNTWTHLVCTFDRDGDASVYMNGVKATPCTGFATLTGMSSQGDTTGDCLPTDAFCIGDTAPAAGQSFDGRIDAALFAKIVFTQEQINILYNNGAGRQMQASDIGRWLANDGSDPRVMMRMSMDGGKTWGIERWQNAGAMGEYKQRVRWNRCGQGRRRLWEVSVTDNIQWRLLGAFIDPREGVRDAQAS